VVGRGNLSIYVAVCRRCVVELESHEISPACHIAVRNQSIRLFRRGMFFGIRISFVPVRLNDLYAFDVLYAE
jgi:hypothetical protein